MEFQKSIQVELPLNRKIYASFNVRVHTRDMLFWCRVVFYVRSQTSCYSSRESRELGGIVKIETWKNRGRWKQYPETRSQVLVPLWTLNRDSSRWHGTGTT